MRAFERVFGVMTAVALCGAVAFAQDGRMVPYVIENAREIPDSLTGRIGDAERGRQLYFNRERSGCSGCHGSPGGPGAELNADDNGAPSLTGVASRMSEGTLRLWIVAPQVLSPRTSMPSYYMAGQRDNPNDPRFGEPRFSARQVEDLVAYLSRQRGQ
ncbi:MAG: cytochrome c [Pseudomonadota bacterium]